MLTVRIIPCLDVLGGTVVKGVRFRELQEVGDPVELARRYERQGADELVFLDVGAAPLEREIVLETIKNVSQDVFIPLTVGGGIRSIADMLRATQAGADKIALCTAALRDPSLLREGARLFGSQCLVLSVDARRCGSGWHACSHGGRRDTGLDAVAWAVRGAELGAGEILLNSIDQDGTRSGYDLELLEAVNRAVNVPVIASGGGGTPEQVLAALARGRADAVLLASVFHEGLLTIPELKTYLTEKGVNIRC